MKTVPEEQAFANDGPPCGLTKREYFAAVALQGLIGNVNIYNAAENAVKLADQLIEELNKESK